MSTAQVIVKDIFTRAQAKKKAGQGSMSLDEALAPLANHPFFAEKNRNGKVKKYGKRKATPADMLRGALSQIASANAPSEDSDANNVAWYKVAKALQQHFGFGSRQATPAPDMEVLADDATDVADILATL